MAHDVFISHSAQDAQVATRLCGHLESLNVKCWLAPRDITRGGDWAASIVAALESSRILLLILTEHSNGSQQVLREIELAVASGLSVIPIRLQSVRLSPSLRFHLAPFQFLDAFDLPIEDVFRRVHADVEAVLESLPAPVVTQEPEGAPDRRDSPSLARSSAPDRADLVLIPAGPFEAGSRHVQHNPPREVTVPAFLLTRIPVTNAQYAIFLKSAPMVHPPAYWEDERFNQPQQPVVGVSLEEAKEYSQWAGLRLPTEWEWEKAARGSDGRRYPWGNEGPTALLANFGDTVGRPTPVESYPNGASPHGILDMAGNVWEWTAPALGLTHFPPVRGGCFMSPSDHLQAAFRNDVRSDGRYYYIGFRCAQDA